jgi:hypothetical protein
MKKFLLLVAGAFMLSTSSWAWELVPFTVNYEDDQPLGHGHGKPSIESPKVYIENYTLSFGINHPEYTLIIKDENDSVVYTTTVFSTQSDVILPSSLSGIYEIRLVMDN